MSVLRFCVRSFLSKFGNVTSRAKHAARVVAHTVDPSVAARDRHTGAFARLACAVFALLVMPAFATPSTPTNQAPQANPDSMHATPGGTARTLIDGTISVLANDTDPDGDELTIATHTNPAHGTLILSNDGTFIYTHDNSPARSDGFTYTACDSSNLCSTANVSIDISNSQQPVAQGDQIFVKPNGATTVLADGERSVLTNDTIAPFHAVVVTVTEPPVSGSVQLRNDGTFQ